MLSDSRYIGLFLVCTVLGFIGVLIGFVPLVALAMLAPIVASLLP